MSLSQPKYYIGQMSGTSLDGVDSVLMQLGEDGIQTLASHHLDFTYDFKQTLLALCNSADDEVHRSAMAANELATVYAQSINELLSHCHIKTEDITAIGAHGQTIRHMPPYYTSQILNAALLTELTGITTVNDFRSRDMAAGGQGAPLVPAFHNILFPHNQDIIVLNIGGMANISVLSKDNGTNGYDTGPGNVLMDAWYGRHLNGNYDEDGNWARCGKVIPQLLSDLLLEPYFSEPAPKSTGRELFQLKWLLEYEPEDYSTEDVQATLLHLTAQSIRNEVFKFPNTQQVIVCGGGAYNGELMRVLGNTLKNIDIITSDELGIDAQNVEALAFAWLAHQCIEGLPGNKPVVTGAKGERVLGAIYPA
jgi:anhydro-N-acetylmuramic acid kinase